MLGRKLLKTVGWRNYLIRSFSIGKVLPKRLCSAPFPEFDEDPEFKSYEQLYEFSINHSDKFWDRVAKTRLQWIKPYNQILSSQSLTGERVNWFTGGKLNASVNCLDRHVSVEPGRIALIEEKDDGTSEYVTYKALLEQVCQIANMLKSHGVKKGQNVALFMPNSTTLVATMLACSRIGAVHTVIFAGFSPDALSARLIDSESTVVVCSDQFVRGGRSVEMKKTLDSALTKCPFVTKVFVTSRNSQLQLKANEIHFENEMAKHPTTCEPVAMDSEDPLFILYTSGSTGRVKGAVHTHAGYLLYSALTHQLVFNYQKGERFGCLADIGWITGHSYIVYGPLLNGGTSLIFCSQPAYPDPSRYWLMVERLQLNHIYLSPTALRMLLKHGDSWVQKHNRSSLKTLGCVGEPLNREAWQWYYEVVGNEKCDVIDTWWQTETGGVAIAPRPSPPNAPIHPATPGRPFFGINPVIVDQHGKEITKPGERGSLCIRQPWPGMARTLFQDHERFYRNFFDKYKGLYVSGDAARLSEQGQFQIVGRTDNVITTSGHRIGTAEVEDAIDSNPAIAESAVVGFKHDIKGEGIYAFIILRDKEAVGGAINKLAVIETIKRQVRNKIAGYAVPDVVHIATSLPRTRTGKIERRILRRIASGAKNISEVGDISAIIDTSVIDNLIKRRDELLTPEMGYNGGRK